MFFNKSNTKKINELAEELSAIRRELKALELDLELYTKKLKASKGLKKVREELDDNKDFKNSVLLPE